MSIIFDVRSYTLYVVDKKQTREKEEKSIK